MALADSARPLAPTIIPALLSVIRAFIAVPLPETIRVALAELSDRLARGWPPGAVRWAGPEKLHLTLRFLGDTQEDRVGSIAAGLDVLAADQPEFDLRLTSVGVFPNARRPRVIWVGLADEENELRALHRSVEEMMCRLGWEPAPHRFKPHLTVGRVRHKAQPRDPQWVQSPPKLGFRVEGMDLIQSRLSSAGAEYTCLHRASFARGASA